MKKISTCKGILLTIVVVVGVLVVGLIIGLSYQKNKISFTDRQMQISGIYGKDYNLADIESVTLKDEKPITTLRTNGFSIGGIKKGHFNVKNDGNCLLFVSGNGKCIRIKIKSEVIYINLDDDTATMDLYDKLVKIMQ